MRKPDNRQRCPARNSLVIVGHHQKDFSLIHDLFVIIVLRSVSYPVLIYAINIIWIFTEQTNPHYVKEEEKKGCGVWRSTVALGEIKSSIGLLR
jgi:hypothetical protein